MLLITIMIKFRHVTIDDFDFISSLRNSNKQYFLSQKDISFKLHKRFIEILKNSDDVYFIVSHNNIDIGTVSLYNVDLYLDKTCEFGRLLIADQYRGKGISIKIMNKMLEYAKEEMNLESVCLSVLKTNKLAIKLPSPVSA